jgi:GNAT superfamily N-acetyltransferase
VTYAVRKVDGTEHFETLAAIHTLTLPGDDHPDYEQGWWWIVFEGKEAVGFAGSRYAGTEANAVYFARCGVLAGHRGHGLQRRLLTTRIRHARTVNAKAVITTTYENPASGNNLIRAGFRLYQPVKPWGCDGTNYWRLALRNPQ